MAITLQDAADEFQARTEITRTNLNAVLAVIFLFSLQTFVYGVTALYLVLKQYHVSLGFLSYAEWSTWLYQWEAMLIGLALVFLAVYLLGTLFYTRYTQGRENFDREWESRREKETFVVFVIGSAFRLVALMAHYTLEHAKEALAA